MRLECTVAGLEGNWLEIQDRWTRREARALFDALTADEWMPLLQGKVSACHLVNEDGDVLSDPASMTAEWLEGCDVALVQFLGSALPTAVRERQNLGNFTARLSWPSSEPTTTAAAPNRKR